MKKMVLGVSMILACLIFLVPPATAATVSHGAPELSAFLASLVGPAPVAAAKHPAIVGKSLCTASADCGAGGTISCSGNNSTTSCSAADQDCSVGQSGYVKCDGVTTSCAACSCDELVAACWDSCVCGPLSFQCSPYRCLCNKNCP